jgi:thiol-disulfide isomerase/thioredoxin
VVEDPTGATEEKGSEAPDFTVHDLEGNAHKLSDFRGKPVLLNFWASWCGPCQMEMPDFQEKYRELEGEVIFLMINMTTGGETVQSAWEFIREKGYTFPVFYDTKGSAANAYSVYSLPTTFFIDAQGNGVARAVGAIDAATLQQGISMIT